MVQICVSDLPKETSLLMYLLLTYIHIYFTNLSYDGQSVLVVGVMDYKLVTTNESHLPVPRVMPVQ